MQSGSRIADNGGNSSDRSAVDPAKQKERMISTAATSGTPAKTTSSSAPSTATTRAPSRPKFGRRAAVANVVVDSMPGNSPGTTVTTELSPQSKPGIVPSSSQSEGALPAAQASPESGETASDARMTWFSNNSTTATTPRLADTELGFVKSIADGTNEKARYAEMQRAKEARERFSQQVADAPQGYQMPMPRLHDIDSGNRWNRLLQTIHSEFDMSCLTACLVNELDVDETWNPDMLLVQLTSDMRDVTDRQAGQEGESAGATTSHLQQQPAGKTGIALSGGATYGMEGLRKRGEVKAGSGATQQDKFEGNSAGVRL